MEVLAHIGVDAASINGDGFRSFAEQEDKLKKSQRLITFDRNKINHAGARIPSLLQCQGSKEECISIHQVKRTLMQESPLSTHAQRILLK